ncbi:hypothetical protein CDL15_Pgr019238 [Punica granatum]|uniref:Uncharacterized protein n=1 Tax=Punica granatum TaxID=22663 RepID=A0A218W4G3_PUNGR|nr:hypothetical protein CDL15_Pgr019238 [Punica granatum]
MDAFDLGLVLCLEETIMEDKVDPLKKGFRPLINLCLDDLLAGPVPVEAPEPWFPWGDNDNLFLLAS